MSDSKDRIDIAEKVIIPIVGIIVSLVTAFIAFGISTTQNEIQKDLKTIQSSQFYKELEQKYIEIFYTEIVSEDERRQKIAISLLLEVDHKLGAKLNQWALSSGILKEKAQAESIKRIVAPVVAPEVQKLKDFEIGIYYKNSSPNSAVYQREAKEIKQKLIEVGILKSKLKIDDKWNGKISDYQIRYELGSEDKVADALHTVLEKVYPQKKFRKQTIRGKTPNFISIFLGP